MMKKFFFLLILVLFLLSPAAVFASNLYVPGDYATIQAAVDAAAAGGDIIILADQVFNGAGNYDIDFNGKILTLRSDGLNPDNCTIDCQHNDRFFKIDQGETITLQGITVKNGYKVGTSNDGIGGAVFCNDTASLIARHCIFKDNTAQYGGALYVDDYSTLLLSDCQFSGNRASTTGGAIDSWSFSATITNCQFNSNSANIRGGAVYTDHAALTTFEKCIFTSNSTDANGSTHSDGGAVFLTHSTARFCNCAFISNQVDKRGGAVYTTDITSFINCTFTLNVGSYQGGAVYSTLSNTSAGDVEFKNCILWGDTTSGGGNEIFISKLSKPPLVTWTNIQDSGYSGSGIISSNPKFVNAAASDVHLQSSSPCIDTGTAGGAPADDLDSYERPFGSGFDMGVYENHQGISSNCPISEDVNGIKHLNGQLVIENQGELIIQ